MLYPLFGFCLQVDMVCGWLAGVCGLDCNLHSVCFLLPGSEQASGAKHAQHIPIQIEGESTVMQQFMRPDMGLQCRCRVTCCKALVESG